MTDVMTKEEQKAYLDKMCKLLNEAYEIFKVINNNAKNEGWSTFDVLNFMMDKRHAELTVSHPEGVIEFTDEVAFPSPVYPREEFAFVGDIKVSHLVEKAFDLVE